MIQLTRLNHMPLVLNSELIEHIEASPDTIISLINGQKLMVLETVEEIVEKVVRYRRAIYAGPAIGMIPRIEPVEVEPNG